jgi:hypothetical protein
MKETDELMGIRDELVGRCAVPPALDVWLMNALLKAFLLGIRHAAVAVTSIGNQVVAERIKEARETKETKG